MYMYMYMYMYYHISLVFTHIASVYYLTFDLRARLVTVGLYIKHTIFLTNTYISHSQDWFAV